MSMNATGPTVFANRSEGGALCAPISPALLQGPHGPFPTSDLPVVLERSADPDLSILMVLYRGGRLATRALATVAEFTDVSYEVIIVDNASPDASGALVRMCVRGATHVDLTSNEGFGPAMNKAAAAARGRFLCFLNPDVEVTSGWASPLLVSASRSGAAGATPMLLNPDGSLQEAGASVDGLGHTHAIGSGDWAFPDDVSTARVVDYASAAALVVSASAFAQVGGFDEQYRLAYFEDADLAFALAEAGLSIWLEPGSAVFHLRGGTIIGRTALDLGHENHQRFVTKWADELAGRPTDIDQWKVRRELRDWRVRGGLLDGGGA